MPVNRIHKDSLFRFLFGDEKNKTNLLQLYNALNNSNYTNPDELEITTIKNVLYMKMKNDVSFILDHQMVLFEHQSTYNPNMPLRGLLYFAELYQEYVCKDDNSIYGPTLLKIPTPRFVVFYNGLDKNIGERLELRLSDAFEYKDKTDGFEWTATMLNINYGHNKEIMLKCKVLEDYSILIDLIRRNTSSGDDIRTAVKKAISYCIENDILKDFLSSERAEVEKVILTEYDEEKHIKSIRRFYQKQLEDEKAENENLQKKNTDLLVSNNQLKTENTQLKRDYISFLQGQGKNKEEIINIVKLTGAEYDYLINS